MRIKSFKARNVNGYIHYDINFNDNLSFLIGLNGCGKTTALKLISGLLSPNYIYLVQIQFESITLVLEENKKTIVINCSKNEKIHLSIDDSKYTFDILSEDRINEYLYSPYIDESEIPSALVKFETGPYVKAIKELVDPIVLGLNRRNQTERIELKSTKFSKRRYYREILRYEGVDIALNEIKDILHYTVRKNSEERDSITNNFRDNLLTELSKFSNVSSFMNLLETRNDFEKELSDLLVRKSKIEKILPNLKIDSLKESFNTFFEESTSILQELIDHKDNRSQKEVLPLIYSWLSLSYQLDNIDKIINIGTEYTRELEKITESFRRLEKSLNLFFEETGKQIEINGEGDLRVNILDPNGVIIQSNSMFELSSGEKQLIVMFAQLALADNSKKDIFIIDEPELSLHLAWQERFVDAMKEAAPNMQFILATHAPAIVQKNDNVGCCINLSKWN